MQKITASCCLFVLWLALNNVASATSEQEATMALNMLDWGSVGGLRIGMPVGDVEQMLHRSLSSDFAKQSQYAILTLTNANDLSSLGVDAIAGVSTYGVDLIFDVSDSRNRTLSSISVGIGCDDLPELARRLGGWESGNPNAGYAWGLLRQPGCHLLLRKL